MVASPYAVFKAAEHDWPQAAGSSPSTANGAALLPRNSQSNTAHGLTAGGWSQAIQGELFPFA